MPILTAILFIGLVVWIWSIYKRAKEPPRPWLCPQCKAEYHELCDYEDCDCNCGYWKPETAEENE